MITKYPEVTSKSPLCSYFCTPAKNFTRAPNELIITCTAENVTTKFRVDIIYLELIVDRIILHPNLQLKIERIWKEKPLKYTYNRYMKYYISLTLTLDFLTLSE